jgi:hypothetical protein
MAGPVYNDTIKNARLQVVIDNIDADSEPGYIEIGTAGMATILATIPLNSPPFDAPALGVMNLAGVPIKDDAADNDGIAAEARIKSGDGVTCVSGLTVGSGGSGKHIELASVNITAGLEVRINSGTILHP